MFLYMRQNEMLLGEGLLADFAAVPNSGITGVVRFGRLEHSRVNFDRHSVEDDVVEVIAGNLRQILWQLLPSTQLP